jgi:cytochrome c556
MKKLIATAVMGAVIVTQGLPSQTSAASINASPEHTIEYRQNIMKAMDAHATAIGQILALMVPPDNLAGHFEGLLISTRQAKAAFKDHVEGGESKPEVWTNWADFSAKLDKMEEGALRAVEAAKSSSEVGYIAEFAVDAMACKGCHDVYREKK